jgi:uncharacterized membrane protein YbaN (DUF454 family)
MARVLWWIVPAFLLAAGLYELVLLVRGDTDPRTFAFVANVVMLLGAGLAALSIPFDRPVRAIVFYAPSAAAFALARFYSYDSYYSPTLRRYADGGAVETAWVFLVVAAAVGAGVLTWRLPRTGAVVTGVVLVVLAGTTALMGSH